MTSVPRFLTGILLALGACATAHAEDHFSGRYRSVSGADHDVIVVAPAEPGHWRVALERAGWPPTPYPDGELLEAPPAKMTQWFAEPGTMRCLMAERTDAFPLLCSLPTDAALRFSEAIGAAPPSAPLLHTGWLLFVRTRQGVDVTELVKG